MFTGTRRGGGGFEVPDSSHFPGPEHASLRETLADKRMLAVPLTSPRVGPIEVALRHPQVDPPGLVEGVASRLRRDFHLTVSPGYGFQLIPLELLQDFPLFSVQLVAHDDLFL